MDILVPRNIEGRQNKLRQQAIKLLSQETIDGDFILEKYMLDIPEDLIKVKVINGDFICDSLDLKILPAWFKQLTINGNFTCNYNYLKTLENCPSNINGSLFSYGNIQYAMIIPEYCNVKKSIFNTLEKYEHYFDSI